MKKVKVFADGSFLAYRSRTRYYRSVSFKSHSGKTIHTGTIFSVLRDLLGLAKYFSSDDVAEWGIAWDKKPTHRIDIDKDYKAHRRLDLTPEDKRVHHLMKMQMKELRIIFRHLGINQYFIDGYEADDVLATLAKENENYTVRLITNDKDLYQTISDNVAMYTLSELKDYNWFKEKYRIEPSMWTSVQALTGDSTDNVKGLNGVGEKTAIKLLNAYGSAENAVKNLKGIDVESTLKIVKKANSLVTLEDSLDLACIEGDKNILAFRKCLVVKRMKKALEKLSTFKEF